MLSAGSVHVLGTDVSRLDAARRRAYRASSLGLLDQHYARSLSPDLTCRQTVALQLELLGHDAGESRACGGRCCSSRVGLADRGDDLPGALSGGEQQRVAVCAAVAHRPRPAARRRAGRRARRRERRDRLPAARRARPRDGRDGADRLSHDAAATSIADRIVHVRDGADRRGGPAGAAAGARRRARRLGPAPGAASPRARSACAVTVEAAAGRLVLHARRADSDARRSRERTLRAAPARTGEVVAELAGASKRFGDARAAARSSTISTPHSAPGCFTAVVGRSGSGKTTLLHICSPGSSDRPTATSLLLGERWAARDRHELAEFRRAAVALVTQEPGLVPVPERARERRARPSAPRG